MALLLLDREGQAKALLILASFGLSRAVVANLVARLYHKERPYQRFGFEPRSSFWFSRITDKRNSFPSKHVAGLVSISMMLFFFYPIAGVLGLLVAVMAGWARVIMGYHYVSDLLAGALIGVVGALIVYYFGYPLLFTAL